MKKALVGCTGFVGSNLALSTDFSGLFHSKNIREAFEEEYDLLVYAGLRAEKFLANQDPAADWQAVEAAMENMAGIKARRRVLISTVDVYKNPLGVSEATSIDEEGLHPYGLHRWRLEQWVARQYPDALIVRLPGLYGKGLKKNFLFDLIQVIPSLIKETVMAGLELPAFVADKYRRQENGFFKLQELTRAERQELKTFFQKQAFNALSFTDSRSRYQFYPLACLWEHLERALRHDLRLLCLNSEPVSAGELYREIRGESFSNWLSAEPAAYDMKSRYAQLLGGAEDYVFSRERIVEDIRRFVRDSEAGDRP